MLTSLKNCATEKIYLIKDPSELTFIDENRDIDEKVVSQLVNAFKQDEYIFPIYITTSGQIIDGQHRVAAFKRISSQYPNKYFLRAIIIESTEKIIDLVIKCNAYRRNWTTQNYLKTYTKLGIPSYIILSEFLQKYPLLDTKSAIQLIKGSHSTETYKKGALSITIEEEELAYEKVEFLNQIYNILKDKRVFRRDCILGFYRVFDQIKLRSKFLKNLQFFITPNNESMKEWYAAYQKCL